MAGDVVHLRGGQLRRRVVVTFALRAGPKRRLAETLGTGFELVDIKSSSGDEDIVLVPSSSRQLVEKLRDAFPGATLLVVEAEDAVLGVEFGGQVLRTLDAGADGYFPATRYPCSPSRTESEPVPQPRSATRAGGPGSSRLDNFSHACRTAGSRSP